MSKPNLVDVIQKKSLSDIAKRVLKYARRRTQTVSELADAADCSPKAVRTALAELDKAGSQVMVSADVVATSLTPQMNPEAAVIPWSGHRLEFAVVSDTHLGSRYEQCEHLASFYAECERRKLDLVLHAGDMHDGENMYKGHAYEIKVHGADAQAQYAKAVYPHIPGITTKFISGNHDDSFHKRAGVDVCKILAGERPDLQYLGPVGRTVNLECKGRTRRVLRVTLLHPSGGAPYARSYRTQKIVEGLEGGSKPDLLLAGHLHFQNHTMVRNVQAFQLPCFQRQTPYLKAKGLEPVVGAYFFAAEFSNDGTVGRLVQELVTWYVPSEPVAT